MRLLPVVLFLSLIFACHPAAAQKLLLLSPQSPLQLLEPGQQPKTITDYANLYYLSCLKANTSPTLKEYVGTQCACTAAALPGALSFKQAEKLFDPDTTDSYYYTRLMTLAYIPCLKDSVHDFTFDGCLASPPDDKLRHKVDFCGCVADNMARVATGTGASGMMPGFKVSGFDLSQASANPFASIIASPALEQVSGYYTKSCLGEKEFRW